MGKCHFIVREGIVPGHKISEARMDIDRAKINIISGLPPSSFIRAIRSFLGYVGFYRRFIKYFVKISRPLTKLLEKDAPFEFNNECMKAFLLLKEKLVNALMMIAPDWTLSFEIMCDANNFTGGSGTEEGKAFHPIYHAIKTLNDAQEN